MGAGRNARSKKGEEGGERERARERERESERGVHLLFLHTAVLPISYFVAYLGSHSWDAQEEKGGKSYVSKWRGALGPDSIDKIPCPSSCPRCFFENSASKLKFFY